MKFALSEEQLALAEAIGQVIEAAGGTSIARQWAAGEHGPGLALWRQLAELGVHGLCIDEADGGMSGTPADLLVAFEQLGYYAVPGPYLESIALLPDLVASDSRTELAEGSLIATASVSGLVPYALDTAVAQRSFIIDDSSITAAEAGKQYASLDESRTLSELLAHGESVALDAQTVATAIDRATLGCAAVLLGAGERLLAEAVSYAKIREQFGRSIGEYQGLKHQLADVRVALTFARPLLLGAAVDLGGEHGSRSVSAAKVAAGRAAELAARTALQVHGAIGYTHEHDLGLWLTRVQALVNSWGTERVHRSRIASSILIPTSRGHHGLLPERRTDRALQDAASGS